MLSRLMAAREALIASRRGGESWIAIPESFRGTRVRTTWVQEKPGEIFTARHDDSVCGIESHEIFQNPMNPVESYGVPWGPMKSYEILWDPAKSIITS